jgi:hypothetical protein
MVIFEQATANFDFVVRHLTVLFYMRTLSVRWLHVPGANWSIDPATAPSAMECLVCLGTAALVLTALGAVIFSVREFRLKTPEGS